MKEEGQRGCSGVQREGKCGEGLKEETICGRGGIKSGRMMSMNMCNCSNLASEGPWPFGVGGGGFVRGHGTSVSTWLTSVPYFVARSLFFG